MHLIIIIFFIIVFISLEWNYTEKEIKRNARLRKRYGRKRV
jgi:hypothetical protein